jgi:hypothetical protein
MLLFSPLSASAVTSQRVPIPLLRRGGADAVGDGVVCCERHPIVLTTPALRATPPREGNWHPLTSE